MVYADLAGDKVGVIDLFLLVGDCTPWLRHGCFETFFGYVEKVCVFFKVHTEEFSVAIDVWNRLQVVKHGRG